MWVGGSRDLGYRGLKFTWRNKRDSAEFVKERLDRTLATGGWCAQFPMVVVEVLAALSSDHNPLWIRF
jgi:endonuclease/exonuclease/phosphatase family metal-dependent hydrolase